MAAVTTTVPALFVAHPVRAFFERSGASGRVLATFERSCYLESAEGQLIAVLEESLGRGAFALTVGGSGFLVALRRDDPVSVQGSTLTLGELPIDLTAVLPWDPTLPPLTGPAEEGLQVLAAHLRANAPEEGLSRVVLPFAETSEETPAAPLLDRGRRALARLRAGLTQADAAAITGATADLAGLGPGLTPSGDDVLAGFLLAVRLWSDTAGPLGARIVSSLIVGTAAPRTGRISRAYLWAARQGHASEAWHDLARALSTDLDGVIRAATRIMQTGETSGADMLAGFVVAGTR